LERELEIYKEAHRAFEYFLLPPFFCLFQSSVTLSSIKKISNGAAAQESEGMQDQNDEIEDVQEGPFPVEQLQVSQFPFSFLN